MYHSYFQSIITIYLAMHAQLGKTQQASGKSVEQHHQQYRPDIDGLRAVAVLSVVGFHAFPAALKGGFVGVDVFFVISGFLITSIILRSLDQDSFSLSDFYVRRVKRIFPALLLVLFACYAVGWFTLLADEYKQLGSHIAAGAGFIANFALWSESGYFDNSSETKPLLHLWSLGIEEQFYIIWPLLVWFAFKRRFNLITIIVLAGLVSFMANVKTVRHDEIAAFYSPQTRVWELLIGSLLAYVTLYRGPIISRLEQFADRVLSAAIYSKPITEEGATLRNVGAFAGAVLIAFPIYWLEKDHFFPGKWALLPSVGAALIIWAGPTAWLNRTILSNPLLKWFGLISFPLYLWHWPILTFARIFSSGSELSGSLTFLLILASIALAWGTYLLIEKPFRFGKHHAGKTPLAIVLMVSIGFVGYYTYKRDGLESRLPESFQNLSDAVQNEKNIQAWRHYKCFLSPHQDQSNFTDDCTEKNKRPLVFLWGDSHAASISPGLKSLQAKYQFGIAQYTAAGCPALFGGPIGGHPHCQEINNLDMELIIKLKPDMVLLHSAWYAHRGENAIANFETTVSALKKIGIPQIVVIGPLPRWNRKLSRELMNHVLRENGSRDSIPLRMTYGLVDNTPALDEKWAAMSRKLGVRYISAYRAMCNDEGCLVRSNAEGHELTTYDDIHLTTSGAEALMSRIGPQIFEDAGPMEFMPHASDPVDGHIPKQESQRPIRIAPSF